MFCVFWDCALAKMQCVRVPAIAWLTVPLPRGFAAVFVVTVVVAAASLCLRAPALFFLHLCSGFSRPAELLQQLLNKTCPCKHLSATHLQKNSRLHGESTSNSDSWLECIGTARTFMVIQRMNQASRCCSLWSLHEVGVEFWPKCDGLQWHFVQKFKFFS